MIWISGDQKAARYDGRQGEVMKTLLTYTALSGRALMIMRCDAALRRTINEWFYRKESIEYY